MATAGAAVVEGRAETAWSNYDHDCEQGGFPMKALITFLARLPAAVYLLAGLIGGLAVLRIGWQLYVGLT